MIQRLSSILLLALFALTACLDGSDEVEVNDPRGTLEDYIEANDVSDHTLTDSGLYYKVLSEGESTDTLESVDVLDYFLIIYSMNGDLIYNGFDPEVVWVTSLGEDAISLQGIVEAFLLNNIGDSLSLLVPNELALGAFGGLNGSIYPNEDLRIILKGSEKRLSPLDYIIENGIEEYFSTESGLHYSFDNDVEADFPSAGQVVEVHYTGYLFDGTKFDSSVDRGQTFSFTLGAGQVIPGWDEGIALFKKGQTGTLYIPYQLGYGLFGAGDVIAPYDNLLFEVELIDF